MPNNYKLLGTMTTYSKSWPSPIRCNRPGSSTADSAGSSTADSAGSSDTRTCSNLRNRRNLRKSAVQTSTAG